ncbi:MAG: transcriptional repressor [Alphaproteobacteria bacterium]|nr:transcriptional repressor [Alphaproteobacteria bacterium]
MKIAPEELLRQHNLSLTAVRLALLEALHANPHSDAARIFDVVHNKIAAASKQAIYNNLNTLVECGIVREIKPKGQASLYETRTGDNHHHIVCRSCAGVFDTDCHDCAPCLTPKDSHGFVIDEAEVIFWGVCPSCQNNHNSKGKNNAEC